jgi:hypothetical protein
MPASSEYLLKCDLELNLNLADTQYRSTGLCIEPQALGNTP